MAHNTRLLEDSWHTCINDFIVIPCGWLLSRV